MDDMMISSSNGAQAQSQAAQHAMTGSAGDGPAGNGNGRNGSTSALEPQREQLRMLSRHLVQVQEDERRSLSRDLHDTSGQAMTVLNLGLAALKHEGACTEKMHARIDDLRRVVETVAQDLHRLSVNLRPSSLDRYGLVPALDQFLGSVGQQAKVDISFEVEGLDERLPGDIETALFRIAQEASTNIARYAHATEAHFLLRRSGDRVYLDISDNGQGFDVDEALSRGRLGVVGMRERAEMLGGSFNIDAAPGRGTRLAVTVPLPDSPAAAGAGAFGSRAPFFSAQSAAATAGVAAELARAKALSDVLVDVMASAAQTTTADGILSLVLERAATAIGCDAVHIDVRDGAHWVTRYDSLGQEHGRRFEEEQVPALMWVERTREVLVVNDTAGEVPDESLRLVEYGVRSYACVPLASHAALRGILCFVNFQAPESFPPSEVEFFNRLAALVALALENIQLSEAQAEQRDLLARRVEELETLLEVLPVGIGIAMDPECKAIRTNPAFARMLDLPVESNASLSADELEKPQNFRVLSDGRELTPEELPMQVAAAEGRTVNNIVVDVVRDDGATVTLLEYAAPLYHASGRPRGSVGAFIDITDRLATEVERARLLNENQRQGRLLNELLSALPVGVSVMRGREYRYEMVNAVFEQLLGVRAAEIIGRTIFEAFPEAAPPAVELWDKVFMTGETVWVHEQLFNLGGGREETYWDGIYVPMRDVSGAVDGILVLASEVTEQVMQRKQAEQTSYTLKALLDYIPEGITIADAPGVTIRHVSRYGQELLGGAHDELTAGEVAAQWAVFEPDGVTPVPEDNLPLVRAVKYGETVRDRELVQVNGAGDALPLLCTAGPIRSDAGEVTGGIVAWRDISALKEARSMLAQREVALREALKAAQESEARYRLLFETMDEGFMLVQILPDEKGNDYDFRVLDMNPAAVAFVGLPQEQIIGRTALEIDPDGDGSWLEFYGRVARTGKPERFRNYARFEDRWYELHAFSPGPGLTAVVYQDISQNLRVEADLRATNAELEAILNAVADGLVVNDASGRVVRMNAVAEYMLGYTEEDRALSIQERIPAKMQLLQPDGTPYPLDDYPPVRALKGEVSVAREVILRAAYYPDRETRVLASAGPIYTAEGAFLGAVTLLTDINELHEARMGLVEANEMLRKQREWLQDQARELRESAAQLEDRVAERTASLQQVQRELEALAEQRAEDRRFVSSVMDHVPSVIAYVDRDSVLRQCNRAAAREFGFTGEEAIGQRMQDVTPGNSLMWAAVESVLDTGRPYHSPVLPVYSPQRPERERYFMVDFLPDWDEAGQVRGVFCQGHNVTELTLTRKRLEQTEAELRVLARRLVEMQERERSYVADRLYNETGQVLSALNIQLALLEQRESKPQSLVELAQMKVTLEQTIRQLHALATQLHPAELKHADLAQILRSYVEEFGRAQNLPVRFESVGTEGLRPSSNVSLALYRALQEGVENIRRHARARHVHLRLYYSEGSLTVRLADDGDGFDPLAPAAFGPGLLGVRERIQSVGGSATVESGPAGTTLTLQVPIQSES